MIPLHEGHSQGGVVAGVGTEVVVAAGLGMLVLVLVTGYLLASGGDRGSRDTREGS